MYNGIGLETARGSGTNGYVQRNMAFVRPRRDKVSYRTEEEIAKSEALLNREPNLEILEHERKRKIELKCMEMRELFEVQGDDEDTVEKKVEAYRQKVIEKDRKEAPQPALDDAGRPIVSGTHQIAAASMDRNQKLRNAFGISAEYVDGSSMDPNRKQREMDARAVARQKYALVKDPDDDLPSVKVTSAKSEARKDPPASSSEQAKRKAERDVRRRSRSSSPEEGEVRQDAAKSRRRNDDRRPGDHTAKRKRDGGKDKPSPIDDRKKEPRRPSPPSSSTSGSESDTEDSDSDRDRRKHEAARAPLRHESKRHASPMRERNAERKRNISSPDRNRGAKSPDRKRQAVLPKRSLELERPRTLQTKRPKSPRRQRSNSPRHPSRKSSERQRPVSPERARKSPERGRKSLECGRKSHERSRKSPERARKSPERGRKSLECGRKSHERSRKSPERGRKSPERGRKSPAVVNRARTNGSQTGRKSPVRKADRRSSSSSSSSSDSSRERKRSSPKVVEKRPSRRRSNSSSDSSPRRRRNERPIPERDTAKIRGGHGKQRESPDEIRPSVDRRRRDSPVTTNNRSRDGRRRRTRSRS